MFWQYNYEIIKSEYNVYLNLLTCETQCGCNFDIERIENTNNLRVKKSDSIVYLHSMYDTSYEAENMLESKTIEDVIIIYGAGLFYHVEYIANKYPDKIIVVVEPNVTLFREAMKMRKLDILRNPKITLFLSDEVISITNYLIPFLKNFGYKSFTILPLLSYLSFDGDGYNAFLKELTRTLQFSIINLHTELFFLKEWTVNQVLNYKHMVANNHPLLNVAFTQKIGVPAVIVGAGPSLTKNIDVLKANLNKVLVIAGGSSIGILKKHGIIPHISVVLDAAENEDKIIADIDEKSILAYYPFVSHSGLIKNQSKQTYFLGNDSNFFAAMGVEEYDKLPKIQIGPSCMNVATDIAVNLGCSEVILIGQDMAYTEKKLYAEGAALFDTISSDTRKRYNVKDIYGNMTETNSGFLAIKSFFEVYNKILSGTQLVNCTEGGLGIEGVNNEKLSNKLDTLPVLESNLFDVLHDLMDSVIEKTDMSFERMMLESYKKEIHSIYDISLKRLNTINSLVDRLDVLNIQAIKKELDELLKLTDSLDTFDLNTTLINKRLSVLDMTLRHKVNTEIEAIEDIKEKYTIVLQNMRVYYDFYHQVADVVKEKLLED